MSNAEQDEQTFHDRVALQIDTDGVAQVRLARPDKMNALDTAMFDGILAAGAALQQARGLRAVVLHGEGRAFCAGLDMASFVNMAEGGASGMPGLAELQQRTHGLANRFQQVAWQWRELAVPVIAAIQGVAYGGGLQIALGADLRLLAADARMSVMEMQWGLVPDMAGIPLLRELLRADIARDLVFSARIVPADEACAIGLATRICPDPLAEALAMARNIAGRNPDAVRAAKRLLNQMSDGDAASLLMAESVEQQRLVGSPNQREAVRAAMGKRPGRFTEPD
ncbi:crotonase/enoyl-CoA hydratase family protein [Pseudorhodoferax sp. Leaf267]|uniref:crotonase/enoyl-CoA hydratase family protein n=1 Tax=Pseudorhodoferax sp. Leaf267 TaxID=1736316 RepID=UPI0006F26F2E|nr:crotonase/enoyl-CoA hydratase family protein [Pseudorhodoferax sp. Leaf267]KQP13099.1 enoyl-CoA hydratase [Pseudorhodoferax sp. Leaf267]